MTRARPADKPKTRKLKLPKFGVGQWVRFGADNFWQAYRVPETDSSWLYEPCDLLDGRVYEMFRLRSSRSAPGAGSFCEIVDLLTGEHFICDRRSLVAA